MPASALLQSAPTEYSMPATHPTIADSGIPDTIVMAGEEKVQFPLMRIMIILNACDHSLKPSARLATLSVSMEQTSDNSATRSSVPYMPSNPSQVYENVDE